MRGCSTFRRMEDDRLNQLRHLAEAYQQILEEYRPKLVSNAHRLDEPIRRIHVGRDMEVVRKKVNSSLIDCVTKNFFRSSTFFLKQGRVKARTNQGSQRKGKFLNCRAFSFTVQASEKAQQFQSVHFIDYPESFLYNLYVRSVLLILDMVSKSKYLI